jgi:membrane-associated phospholipid phosphatase
VGRDDAYVMTAPHGLAAHPISRRSLVIAAVVCAGTLAALSIAVTGGALPAERRTLIELRDAFGSSLDDAMIAVRDGTNTLPLAGAALVIVIITSWRLRRPLDALVFALAFGLTVALNPVLKELVGRARPDLWPALVRVSQFSFPSGHAANSGALVGGLVVIVPARHRRLAIAGGGIALAIVALSQLILGVHYPSDIVGGWLWAAACTAAVWSLRAQSLPRSNRMQP